MTQQYTPQQIDSAAKATAYQAVYSMRGDVKADPGSFGYIIRRQPGFSAAYQKYVTQFQSQGSALWGSYSPGYAPSAGTFAQGYVPSTEMGAPPVKVQSGMALTDAQAQAILNRPGASGGFVESAPTPSRQQFMEMNIDPGQQIRSVTSLDEQGRVSTQYSGVPFWAQTTQARQEDLLSVGFRPTGTSPFRVVRQTATIEGETFTSPEKAIMDSVKRYQALVSAASPLAKPSVTTKQTLGYTYGFVKDMAWDRQMEVNKQIIFGTRESWRGALKVGKETGSGTTALLDFTKGVGKEFGKGGYTLYGKPLIEDAPKIVSGVYPYADKYVKKVTDPLFERLESRGATPLTPEEASKKFGEGLAGAFISEPITAETIEQAPFKIQKLFLTKISGLRPKISDFGEGYYYGLRTEPTKVVTYTALAFYAPTVIGKVAGGFVKIPAVSKIAAYKIPLSARAFAPGLVGTSVGQIAGTAVSYGLPTAYATSIYYRTKTADRPFFELGKISATEITPFAVGGYAGAKIIPKVQDLYRYRGVKEIKIDVLGEIKPFMKVEGAYGTRAVYMKRVEAFQWTKPSTWVAKIKGYKPGQFSARYYRIAEPAVAGKALGYKQIEYWDIVKGKLTRITTSTKKLPMDSKGEQLEWFTKKQLQKYYLPRGEKGAYLGYSATPQKWSTEEIAKILPEYISGKGTSVAFFRIGTKSYKLYGGSIVSPYGDKPYLYAEYSKKIKVLKPRYEARIQNPFDETAIKPVKKYIFDKELDPATIYVTKYKPEVEANIYGLRVPKEESFFRFAGRKIGLQQSLIVAGTDVGGTANIIGTSYGTSSYVSSYPITTPATFIPGLISYPSSKSSASRVSTMPSSYYPSSKTSATKISGTSSSIISYPSSGSIPSYPSYSMPSYPSAPSMPSIPSKPSKPSRSSIPSIPSYPSYSPPPPPEPPVSFIPKYKPFKVSKLTPRGVPALGRRFGKFKVIGVGAGIKEAINIGKRWASRTLGATFKVTGARMKKLPGFKTKVKKGEVLYIEPRSRRLKRGTGEIPEIQYFKKLKGGRKK